MLLTNLAYDDEEIMEVASCLGTGSMIGTTGLLKVMGCT